MTEPELTLDAQQRDIVEKTVADHCRVRRWQLHTVNCRTQHVHLVVTAPNLNRYPVLSAGGYNRAVGTVLTFKKATVMKAKADSESKSLSRHIVVDPRICHGKPAFRGTRVLVSDVLDQVATGMSWDAIIAEWNGNLTKEAIAEAVVLASQALLRHSDEFALEPVSA